MKAADELTAANQGEGCLGKAARFYPKCPVFVLSGNDLLAPDVLQAWIDAATKAGVSQAKLKGAIDCHIEMSTWQATHRAHLPD